MSGEAHAYLAIWYWILVEPNLWGYIELLQVLKQKAALNSRMRHNKLRH